MTARVTLAVVLAGGLVAEASTLRLVVADVPYERVWAAALLALEGYPVERAADGAILTAWAERPARPEESAFDRVAERLTLRVEPMGVGITRVTVLVDAEGRRGGGWVPIADTEPMARAILARLRAALP